MGNLKQGTRQVTTVVWRGTFSRKRSTTALPMLMVWRFRIAKPANRKP